jgi:regulatory protein
MTSHDDQAGRSDGTELAPVTPLFGRRGAGSADRPARSRGAAQAAAPHAETGVDASSAGDAVTETAARLEAISSHWSAADTEDEAVRASSVPTASGRDTRRVAPVDEGVVDDDDDEPEDLESQRRRAENVSLHALSRRGVSSSEMTKLLLSRDLDEQVVVDEVERLEGVGLLNDRELADNLVRAKQERKGLGRGAVTSELRQRGLDASVVEEALAEIDDDDEQARCDEWALKRAGSLRGLDHETAQRRLHGYLMRRGYRSETIRRSIDKALPRGGGPRGGGPRGGSSRGGGVRFE